MLAIVAFEGTSNSWQQVFLVFLVLAAVVEKQIKFLVLRQIEGNVLNICIIIMLNHSIIKLASIGIIILQIMREIVYSVFFSAVLITLATGSAFPPEPGYPDCLKSIAPLGNEVYAMEKYLTKYQKMYPLMNPYNFTEIKSTVISNQKLPSFSVFLCLSWVIGLFLIWVRFYFSESPKMSVFATGNCNVCLYWSIVILTLFATFNFSSLYQKVYSIGVDIREAECAARFIPKLLIDGETKSGWGGYAGLERVTELHQKYCKIIEALRLEEYEFSTRPVKKRIGDRVRFPAQFQKTYENAELVYNDTTLGVQKVTYKQLFPEFFNPANYGWKKSIDEINEKFINMTKMIMNIQVLTREVKIGGGNYSTALKRKSVWFSMSKKLIQGIDDWTKKFDSYREGTDIAVVFILNVIALGIVSCLCYAVVVLLLWVYKIKMLLKIANFMWIIIVVEFIACVAIWYLFTGPAMMLSAQCKLYSSVLKKADSYHSYVKMTDPNRNLTSIPPTYENLHYQLYPCFFESGDFNSLSADFREDSRTIVELMTTLKNYIDSLDPTSTQFIDLFGYHTWYNSLIKEVSSKKFNNEGTGVWPYITKQLNRLNNETLKNPIDTGCYKHKWVFQIKDCPKGSYILNPYEVNQLIIAPGEFNRSKVQCMILFNQNEVGDLKLLTFDKIARNYLPHANISRCNITAVRVMDIALDLLAAIQIKMNSINSLVQELNDQRNIFRTVFTLVRTNHLQNKRYYDYFLSNGNTTLITLESEQNYTFALKNHTDCRCVKNWTRILHRSLCLRTRTTLVKNVYVLIQLLMCLGPTIFFGILHGFFEEVELLSHDYYMELQNFSDQGEGDLQEYQMGIQVSHVNKVTTPDNQDPFIQSRDLHMKSMTDKRDSTIFGSLELSNLEEQNEQNEQDDLDEHVLDSQKNVDD